MTRRAVCPGSFDPVTNGHLDVATRAAALFDEVVVAVMHNPAKEGTFPVEVRLEFLRTALQGQPTLRVEAFGGQLLVDVCRALDAVAIVKGLRDGADYAFELPMAQMNRHLTGVETVFIPGNPAYAHVSSSLVKEVVRYGGDVSGLVPAAVLVALPAAVRGGGIR
ncbi:MAG TPA: pantetheine-phosphate adenylyltransferase [Candidatus Lustribacter sp.]|nr:pantetheine-phosphate adenylyltransferase [Candidatus Lustribacter sp.]